MVFTSVEEIVHWTKTKRAGVKGSYTDGLVKYLGMAMQAVGLKCGSVDDDERSFLDDQSIVLSAL